jgi:predicted small lipoprotein YifL
MRLHSRAGGTALVLTVLLSLAACSNKGAVEKPATAQTTNAVPGTGAGQSETGATGGSATSPGSEAGAVAGGTSSGEGRAASEGSAPTSSK